MLPCLIRWLLETLSFLPHLLSKVTGFGWRTSFTRPHGQSSINPCRKEWGQAPGKSMYLLHSCKAFIDKHVPRKWVICKNAQWACIGNYWRSSITTTRNLYIECHSPHDVLSFYWCQDMDYRFSCLMGNPLEMFLLEQVSSKHAATTLLPSAGALLTMPDLHLRELSVSQKPTISWTELLLLSQHISIYHSIFS